MMIRIRTEGLGKVYKIYKKPIDSFKELFTRRSYHEALWALKDIDLSLSIGQSLGVIGENGAGKTTLLQLLAGTISPTHGSVTRNGRVSAILELGSGFHPDLSGMENIRLGCATLGLPPAEITRRMPEIIAFSELEKFINHPVKTYSTGMYARLAFSVATAVDPDILVVDEALSVGDQHFQKKSIDRMMEFRERGKTLVFCSHIPYYIQQTCDVCLWLRNGLAEMFGSPTEVTEAYLDYVRALDGEEAEDSPGVDKKVKVKTSGDSYIRDVSLAGDCRDGTIENGGTLRVRVVARLSRTAREEGVNMAVQIVRNDRLQCYGVSTQIDGAQMYPLEGDDYGVALVFDKLALLSGRYTLDVFLMDSKAIHSYDIWKGVAPFKVSQKTKEMGVARLSHTWEKP